MDSRGSSAQMHAGSAKFALQFWNIRKHILKAILEKHFQKTKLNFQRAPNGFEGLLCAGHAAFRDAFREAWQKNNSMSQKTTACHANHP